MPHGPRPTYVPSLRCTAGLVCLGQPLRCTDKRATALQTVSCSPQQVRADCRGCLLYTSPSPRD
eukprot:1072102-Alexandrium_andersonii.AAC.1